MRLVLISLLICSPAFAGHHMSLEERIDDKDAAQPVGAGELLPFSIAARHERLGMLANTWLGRDATLGTTTAGALEATFVDRVTLRASMSNVGMSPQLHSSFGLLVDVMREDTAGIDLAIGGEYETYSYNRVPGLVTRVAAGRTIGATRLLANAAIGLGLQENERYGDLRVGGMTPITRKLYAGLDSRARIDLERDTNEPAGEADYDLQAGPLATYAIGRFAVSASGGVSAWKLRGGEQQRLGAVGSLGLGAVF
jgi:hypothetical protein